MTAKAALHSAVSLWRILIIVLLPVFIVLSSVRLLLTQAYVQLEYRLPGFPADRYGFTLEDRLYWAPIALDYLLNDEGIEFLGDLQFADGTPVYNERELQHMLDVKILVGAALRVWLAVGAFLILSGVVLERRRGAGTFWTAIDLGSRTTLWMMAALGVGLLIGFSVIFVGFHRIFFEGDSWLFYYSDTLIRLFPERFWSDAFIFISLLTAGGALLLKWLAGKRLAHLPGEKHATGRRAPGR